MGSTNRKIGQYLELDEVSNSGLEYGPDRVRGVNNHKKLMPTRADLTTRDLSKFQVVRPGDFVFNHRTSRNGGKFSIAFNDGAEDVICTEDYVVFHVREDAKGSLSALWLYMYFNRAEFDRYVITNSWGSSTEFFNWEDLCDIEIDLPPLPVQEKYVAVYKAMLANQSAYEKGLSDLRLAFDALVEEQKRSCQGVSVLKLLHEVDARNAGCKIREISGINIEKHFMPSTAVVDDKTLLNYKVVSQGQFAYSSMQTGRDKCIRIALQRDAEPKIVSPAYFVFEVARNDVVPEWIMLWFMRKETDRRGWFLSDSSVRANLDLDRLAEVMIPLPKKQVQEEIVGVFEAYLKSADIVRRFKESIQQACQILIKGSLDEARTVRGRRKEVLS